MKWKNASGAVEEFKGVGWKDAAGAVHNIAKVLWKNASGTIQTLWEALLKISPLPPLSGNVIPEGWCTNAAFSPDGTYLAVTNRASNYLTLYKKSGSTLTKLPNPSVMPAGNAFVVSFCSNGIYLAVGCVESPYIIIYKRSGTC